MLVKCEYLGNGFKDRNAIRSVLELVPEVLQNV